MVVLVLVALFVYLLGHNKGRGEDEITPVEEVVQVEDTMSEEAMRYKGTIMLENGIYEGEILEGKPDGCGIAKYNDGGVYDGYWKKGLFNGKGTYTWSDGDKYEGQWNKNKRNGQGSYMWSDGRKYVGEWEKGDRTGQGTLYNADGSISYSGQWINDEPVR